MSNVTRYEFPNNANQSQTWFLKFVINGITLHVIAYRQSYILSPTSGGSGGDFLKILPNFHREYQGRDRLNMTQCLI